MTMSPQTSDLTPHPTVNSSLKNGDPFCSPLELLNLNLSNGKSTGNMESQLWKQMNYLLSWDNIIQKGYQSDLCPLLYFIFYKNNSGKTFKNHTQDQHKMTVERIEATLRYSYYRSLSRNMWMLHELDNILKNFNNEKIPVIVLKGADLAQNTYPDIAFRPMSDIDLLVNKQDLKLVDLVFKQLGYNKVQPTKHCKHSFHITYIKTKNNLQIPIEIHWSLVNPLFFSKINLTLLWERAEVNKSGKNNFLTLCLEDSLLYLCWHGCRHGYSRFIWIYDIALLIKNNGLNVDKLIEYSKKFKIHNSFEFCMVLTSDLLGTRNILENNYQKISTARFNALAKYFVKIHSNIVSNKLIKNKINIFAVYLLDSMLSKILHIFMRLFSLIKIW